MATISALVTQVRRRLKDRPLEDYITDNPLSDSATTMTPNDITLFSKGQVWEFNDGDDTSAERVLVRSVGDTTVTIKRAHEGTTAAQHSQNAVVLLAPRFPYDEVREGITLAIDIDLFERGAYDIVEHTITSSSTTKAYNAPSSSCLEPLRIYQRVNSDDTPTSLTDWHFYANADTSLYANGAYFVINQNLGTPGTDTYYVDCGHRYTLGTLSTQAERVVQAKACYYLLSWEGIKRTAGPTDQGDRTVRPLDAPRLAQTFNEEYERLIRQEAARIQALTPPRRRFRRAGGTRG